MSKIWKILDKFWGNLRGTIGKFGTFYGLY